MAAGPSVDVVIPTIGRPSLRTLLAALVVRAMPLPADALPASIIVVDDRPVAQGPLLAPDDVPPQIADRLRVIRGRAHGPAAARNTGWRASTAEWVAFLDDDVLPDEGWYVSLQRDLAGLGSAVGGSQGTIVVPVPQHRPQTDWERTVAGMERAVWATADMAYRRSVLAQVGGFDERFQRAFREDAELGLRVVGAGHAIERGTRRVCHPIRPADRWVSVRSERGNADDVLMRVLHGRHWQQRASVPVGARPRHLATTACLGLAAGGAVGKKGWLTWLGLAGYIAGVADLARRRIAPGPRTPDEVVTMIATSAVVPLAATYHWLRGWSDLEKLAVQSGPVPAA
ncbi:MAG: glycosyltransferase [Actinomycetota bacterium]|nr:glycosyltransferase [Actinomycetota bacterium]